MRDNLRGAAEETKEVVRRRGQQGLFIISADR